jgi:predicted phosphodiesterase
MDKVRFVGDVHGHFKAYQNIINGSTASIQVGDFGLGFGKDPKGFPWNHYFIRGNHDNQAVCEMYDGWLEDGSWMPLNWFFKGSVGDMMFVGGALSIDKHLRTEGVDWWRDEELSYVDLQDTLKLYVDIKPRIMVTHDCPERIAKLFYPQHIKTNRFPSATRQAFDAMLDSHMPDLWIFGHWHMPKDSVIEDTRFICLDELGWMDVSYSVGYDSWDVEY